MREYLVIEWGVVGWSVMGQFDDVESAAELVDRIEERCGVARVVSTRDARRGLPDDLRESRILRF